MKYKFIFSMAIVAICLSSCDSDRDDQPNEQTWLVSKVTTINSSMYGDGTDVTIYKYNDKSQIITIDEGDGSRIDFTYDSEGKPTKGMAYYDNVEVTQTYIYEDKKLTKSSSRSGNSFVDDTFYTYNSVGKLVDVKVCETPGCTRPYSTSFTYSGNNIITELFTTSSSQSKYENTYTTNRSAYSYMNPYIRLLHSDAEVISENTIATEKYSSKYGDNNWSNGSTSTYTHKYNEQGMPIESVRKSADGTSTTKIVYEYIVR